MKNRLNSKDRQGRSDRVLTSQRNMNMPMWSCSSLVTLRARLSVLPSGSNSSSRLSAPFLSWVHTSISSWQYANVQFSPYWHSCRSCTSVGRLGLETIVCLSDSDSSASFFFFEMCARWVFLNSSIQEKMYTINNQIKHTVGYTSATHCLHQNIFYPPGLARQHHCVATIHIVG